MPVADALAELRACAGTQFDPAVLDALEQVVTERDERGDTFKPQAVDLVLAEAV